MLDFALEFLFEVVLLAIQAIGHRILWIIKGGDWQRSDAWDDAIAGAVGMLFWGVIGFVIWLIVLR